MSSLSIPRFGAVRIEQRGGEAKFIVEKGADARADQAVYVQGHHVLDTPDAAFPGDAFVADLQSGDAHRQQAAQDQLRGLARAICQFQNLRALIKYMASDRVSALNRAVRTDFVPDADGISADRVITTLQLPPAW